VPGVGSVPAPFSPAASSRTQEPHFFAREFEHRSGRIIALCRFALATVFFIALWLAPDQPVRDVTTGYIILFGYMLLASLMLVIAWRNWWWDQRLAWPMHLVDVVLFLAAVYFTETNNDGFTSPFLAFFAYLMLSATIRWDWRVTALTGVSVAGLYLLVGLAMTSVDINLDMMRFGRRITYMVVLALVLVWFGLQRREQSVERFVESPGTADDRLPPLLDALRYAMGQTDAARGAIAWADEEEPHVEVRTLGLDCPAGRLSPAMLPPEAPFAKVVQLFDSTRARILRIGGRRCQTSKEPVADPFARHCRIAEGLALPFTAVTGRGEILLAGISGVCADHVEMGVLIAREIGAGFDRQSTLALVRESALTRMRDGVARDLHDTIAQSLAGASLRLEGLRHWIKDGGDPDSEIQAIKSALRAEQSKVREMIERLRDGESVLPDGTARQTLGPLMRDLAGYWGISIDIDEGPKGIVIPGSLAHELRQVLREAVANAVRHGGASRVAIALAEEDAMLRLTVADDGAGFPANRPMTRPRSISERIASLGGSLDIETGKAGTTLRFALPLGDR
jgi:signal transduction histidine kinase